MNSYVQLALKENQLLDCHQLRLELNPLDFLNAYIVIFVALYNYQVDHFDILWFKLMLQLDGHIYAYYQLAIWCLGDF